MKLIWNRSTLVFMLAYSSSAFDAFLFFYYFFIGLLYSTSNAAVTAVKSRSRIISALPKKTLGSESETLRKYEKRSH